MKFSDISEADLFNYLHLNQHTGITLIHNALVIMEEKIQENEEKINGLKSSIYELENRTIGLCK